MANKYYDSNFTGAQIDAAVNAATSISDIQKPANAGKIVSINNAGKLVAVELSELIENGDAVEY